MLPTILVPASILISNFRANPPPPLSLSPGVAGLVVNEKNEILVVQEKWLHRMRVPHWKLPGGVCDPGMSYFIEREGERERERECVSFLSYKLCEHVAGEDIWQTAMRETFEETGIKTEFVSLLAFRHMHGYKWSIDDLYFTCLLRPLSTDIQANTTEIAAAKWIDVRTSHNLIIKGNTIQSTLS